MAAHGTEYASAWGDLVAECSALSLPNNIESVLSRVRAKIDGIGGTDLLCGLDREAWLRTDTTIRERIAQLVNPPSSTIPSKLPHHDFARWVRNATRRSPVEIFTTNYDVLFERSFDELRVPHFDGFIGSQFPYFSPDSVEDDGLLPSATWVRFWKLHGSVSWSVEDVAGAERITRGKPATGGHMILPSHKKYDESRKQPYRSLMDRLGRVLARQDSLLVACGFSFGDQHINSVVLDAVERHPRTHVIVLSYSDLSQTDETVQWALRHPNIIVAGPNAASMSGRFAEWSVAAPVDASLETATGDLVRPDPSSPLGFKVRAGDFNRFCSFLVAIDRGAGTRP